MRLDIFQQKLYGLFCTNSPTIILTDFSKCHVYRILHWDLHGDKQFMSWRVKVLVVKVLHSESEGSWLKPH